MAQGWTGQAGRDLARAEHGLLEAVARLRAGARADWVSVAADRYTAELLERARGIERLVTEVQAARPAVLVHTRSADAALAVAACW